MPKPDGYQLTNGTGAGASSAGHRPGGRLTRALIIMVAVVGVGAGIATLTTRHHTTHPAAGPVTAQPAVSPPPSSTAPASPSTPPLATTPLTAAPAGVMWQLFQGIALPFSAKDGPTRINGPVYAGYSHTPTGALLAAAQISTRYAFTLNNGWRPVVEQQVLPGPSRTSYIKVRPTIVEDPPVGGFAQIAGFRFVTYDPTTAVIDMAGRGSTGNLNGGDITVRWVDGDWRLYLPDPIPPRVSPPTLAGYVPWQGISG